MTERRPTPPSTSPDTDDRVAEPSALAEARAATYRLLAAAVLSAPRPELVSALEDLSATLAELLVDGGSSRLHRGALSASVEELEAEHAALFIVPGPRCCVPYESVHQDGETLGLLAGPPMIAVRGEYERAGYELPAEFAELPDHVGAELFFMACLCEEEREAIASGDDARATGLREQQAAFLERHLAPFSDRLARFMEGRVQLPFYAAWAELLRAFVRAEVQSGGAA